MKQSVEIHIHNMDNSRIDDGDVMVHKQSARHNRMMSKHLHRGDGGGGDGDSNREDMCAHYCTKLDADTFSLDLFHKIETNSTTQSESY